MVDLVAWTVLVDADPRVSKVAVPSAKKYTRRPALTHK